MGEIKKYSIYFLLLRVSFLIYIFYKGLFYEVKGKLLLGKLIVKFIKLF